MAPPSRKDATLDVIPEELALMKMRGGNPGVRRDWTPAFGGGDGIEERRSEVLWPRDSGRYWMAPRREEIALDVIPAQLALMKMGGGNPGATQGRIQNRKRTGETMGRYSVDILASRRNGTLYIGMTNDLLRRVGEHKNDLGEGFTKKYGVHELVWYETADTAIAAIARKKQLKKWNRAWKLRLIEELNPGWKDLYEEIAE